MFRILRHNLLKKPLNNHYNPASIDRITSLSFWKSVGVSTQQKAPAGYKIRQMTPDDIPVVSNWFNSQGWNLSQQTIETDYKCDPKDFFVGEVNGKITSCISAARTGNYAHIGLYHVDEAYKGENCGLPIFQHALDHVKDAKYVGLDAVPEQVSDYTKSGFQRHTKVVRVQKMAQKRPVENDIVNIKRVPLADIDAYDGPIFGYSRLGYIEKTLAHAENNGFVVYRNNRIRGYGIVRKEFDGYRIVPLVADDIYAFKELATGLENLAQGQKVYCDLFAHNKWSLQFFKEYGWKEESALVRMYLKGVPERYDIDRSLAAAVEMF